jgi:hypothetical protein
MMDISPEMKNRTKMKASYYHRPYDNLVSSYALTDHPCEQMDIQVRKEKENIGLSPNGSGQQVRFDTNKKEHFLYFTLV